MRSRKQLRTAVILLFVVVCGLFFLKKEPKDQGMTVINQSELMDEVVELETEPKEDSTVTVHVCGAVRKEGVYTFPAGARVVDAIEAAQGINTEGAGEVLNQASLLIDGMQLYVPTKEEVSFEKWSGEQQGRVESDSLTESAGLVNINQADRNTLMNLPGVGESKADAILVYREQYGDFQSVEEIMRVPGIKEGVYKKIESLITVGG